MLIIYFLLADLKKRFGSLLILAEEGAVLTSSQNPFAGVHVS